MIAYLVDPKEKLVTEVDFDGGEDAVARLIGSESIAYEQFTGIQRIYHDFVIQNRVNRVYFDVEADGNSNLPGFVIENTGGRVNHGTCLVVGFDTQAHTFTDAIDIRGSISHYFVPGKGAY
jgi:hypothetical protein